jgi:glycosyltransferase involved in cell wall biosynthesis
MKISVIIPTYNEVNILNECLQSLSKQTFKDFEILIVDDGSTDGTSEKFKVIKQNHLGAGAARNLGVKHTKGDILVFVDADMTFDVNFLEKLTEPIRKNFSKGTFSKEEYVSNWENEWARCWNINEGWEEKRRHPKNYPDHQPVFRAILKNEFDKVGGFTPGGYDDDWSLSKKLGYEATIAPNAIFFHKNPSTLSEIFKHAKWVGKRKYKLGVIGYLVALIRSSLPISLILGLLYAIRYMLYAFFIFKLVYDLGVFVGILNLMFTGNTSK